MNETPSPAIVSRLSQRDRWIVLAIFILIFLSMFLNVYIALSAPQGNYFIYISSIIYMVISGWISRHFWQIWKRSHITIQADEAGLHFSSQQCPTERIPWENIVNIKARDLLQQLDIYLADTPEKKIIEYQINNFTELRDYILDKTKSRLRKEIRTTVFHTNFTNYLIIFASLGIGMVGFWLSLEANETTHLLITGVLITISIMILLLETKTVKITERHLIIRYPLWKKKIPYSEVQYIRLINSHRNYSHQLPQIILKLSGKKPIKLANFREGSIQLYLTLEQAWDSGKILNKSE